MFRFLTMGPTRTLLAVVVAVVASGTTMTAAAQSKNAAIDPKAKQMLQAMSAYLAAAKSFSFSARTLFDVVGKSGIKLLKVVDQRFVVQRPNRMYVRSSPRGRHPPPDLVRRKEFLGARYGQECVSNSCNKKDRSA